MSTSTTLFGSTLPRRFVGALLAALCGLTLALNPASAPSAHAEVTAAVALQAVEVAKAQVGIPYKYGGSNPTTGFDCSGLTQYSYAMVGKTLPRTAQQQYAATIPINGSHVRVGDLVFFYSGTTIYHVGIFAGYNYMYVAPHTGALVQKQRIWTTQVYFGRVR
jgi:cell wall-associated NlpC family hydrolase